jgi:hypothetical protein
LFSIFQQIGPEASDGGVMGAVSRGKPLTGRVVFLTGHSLSAMLLSRNVAASGEREGTLLGLF